MYEARSQSSSIQDLIESETQQTTPSRQAGKFAIWVMLSGVIAVFLILLVLNVFVLGSIGGDERGQRRDATTETEADTQPPVYVLSTEEPVESACGTASCKSAARNVTLSAQRDPCVDFYGHVCGVWMKEQRVGGRGQRRRVSVDHAHQEALSVALHQLMVGRTTASLPSALTRLYRRCLEPEENDSRTVRNKLLDSTGVAPWPQPRTDTANPDDVSKVRRHASAFSVFRDFSRSGPLNCTPDDKLWLMPTRAGVEFGS